MTVDRKQYRNVKKPHTPTLFDGLKCNTRSSFTFADKTPGAQKTTRKIS